MTIGVAIEYVKPSKHIASNVCKNIGIKKAKRKSKMDINLNK
jgi:hypothetical protein